MFARVAIETPLPGLDRLFDYEIPAGTPIEPGVRVLVPFGKTTKSGFVIELTETTDWTGKIAQIDSVVSSFPALKPHIYELVRAVADRQAASFGDVIGSAVPVRAVRSEKSWLAQVPTFEKYVGELTLELPQLSARIVEPRSAKWTTELVRVASSQLNAGKSAIICAPDFRDVDRIVKAFDAAGLGGAVIKYNVGGRTDSYEAFLEAWHCDAAGSPRVVVGSRNAIYAPLDAGGIYVWDDGDQSHIDQSSPYATTRELALLRQKLTDCNLAFLSHARSVEVQRLVEIGYLQEASDDFARPSVSCTDGAFRVDSAAWLAIRDGLKTGPVLVQVSSTGVAKSLYCKDCGERARCPQCSGPLWIDTSNHTKCRWCNAFALDSSCHACGSRELRFGKAGATRTAAEFGKSFPGTKVQEVKATDLSPEISDKPQIIVATPGVEPLAATGYAAVVILDANDALNRDTLRASEDAVRGWANAIALMSDQGRAVVVGIQGEWATEFALWKLRELISGELAERTALKFPPAIRMLSATGSKANIASCRALFDESDAIEVLGVTPADNDELRLIARFSYRNGVAVTGLVRELQLRLASGQKRYSPKSGRATRPVTFKLDDPQVL